jgi:hypothetical protein
MFQDYQDAFEKSSGLPLSILHQEINTNVVRLRTGQRVRELAQTNTWPRFGPKRPFCPFTQNTHT